MRWFGWVLLILLGLGWVACEIPVSQPRAVSQQQLDCWRRTPHGWQQVRWLGPAIPPRRPALHPGVVGLLELLVSITALVAFPGRAGPKVDTNAPRVPAAAQRQAFHEGRHDGRCRSGFPEGRRTAGA